MLTYVVTYSVEQCQMLYYNQSILYVLHLCVRNTTVCSGYSLKKKLDLYLSTDVVQYKPGK